jgi:predicted signal transduction protein with EAL and GGDEF domain
VIAEGIETENQLQLLRNLGCDYGQGYLLSKPKRREEAEKLLYENPTWINYDPIRAYEPADADPRDARLPVF